MRLQYNAEMPRAHLRSFFFTLAVAAALGVARGRGQDAAPPRTVLYPYTLPAVDRGLALDVSPGLQHLAALGGQSHPLSRVMLDRTGRSGTPYVPGRVIVKFRDGMSTASRLTAMSAVSPTSTISERPSYANFDVVRIDVGEDAEAVADTFRQRPEVEYAQPAYRIRKEMVPNDTYYKQYQWNLPLIDLERAWDIQGTAGSSVVVAVLDTGIAYQNSVVRFNGAAFQDDSGKLHPALGQIDVPFSAATDLASPGRFVAPHDFIWDDNFPYDLDFHGTHVSGTIGQLTNNNFGVAGVAFNVKLMPVKVIDSDWDDIFGAPNQGTDDVVARGIRYAADNGAKVINMSIGRTGAPAPAIEDAIKYAVGKGVFIAIAAGNDFEDGNPTEVLAEIASRVQGAVSVAAVDRAKAHAYYSSTGSWVELSAPGGSERGFGSAGLILQQTYDPTLGLCIAEPNSCGVAPSLTAPRFDVLVYLFLEGTSMATPHVSGLAAMLIQQGITNPAAIEAALEKFATDLGDPGRDDTFGYGMIEARDTLRGLGLAK
jgi:serine protease